VLLSSGAGHCGWLGRRWGFVERENEEEEVGVRERGRATDDGGCRIELGAEWCELKLQGKVDQVTRHDVLMISQGQLRARVGVSMASEEATKGMHLQSEDVDCSRAWQCEYLLSDGTMF